MENNSQSGLKKGYGSQGWFFMLVILASYFVVTCLTSCWQIVVQFWGPAYGWDGAALLSIASIGGFITIVCGFIFGRIGIKVEGRTLALICGAILLICTAVVGFVKDFTLACVLIAIITSAGPVWIYNLNPLMVSNWFPRKKGMVMGIVTIGIPLGSGLTAKIFAFVAAKFGMQYAFMPYLILGIIIWLLLLLWMRENPEKRGYNPDNDASMTHEEALRMMEEGKRIAASSPWTTANLLKTKEVWILALPLGLQMMFSAGIMTQMLPRLLELGYPQPTAINFMLVNALFACLGSFLSGVIDSKFGPRRAIQLIYICAVVSLLLNIFFGKIVVILFISFFFNGCVIGGSSNFVTSLVLSYWGRFNFARTYGIMQPIVQAVGACAYVYMAQVSANFGGYTAAYAGLVILEVIGLIVFSLIKDGSFVAKAEEKFKK